MSIAGIGGGIGNSSQMLSILLSRLDQNSSSTAGTDDSTSTTSTSNSTSQPAITGSGKPSLSSMVIGALIGEQMQSSDPSNSSTSSTSSAQDPVQSLFSSMDTDGDGEVSQAEMESYIQNKGGTQIEADTLYGMLTQDGSNSLTETQLASQAPPPPPGGPGGVGGHHGHHHHHSSSSTDGADALMQALDADSNGSVDQNELTSFVTSNGGTEDQASSIFASLDTSNTGAISSSDFAAAIENLQGSNSTSTSNALVMTMLNAFDRTSTTSTQSLSIAA